MNLNREFHVLIKKQLDLVDQFAIEFYRWMMENDTMENAEKWFGYSDEDMLQAYKLWDEEIRQAEIRRIIEERIANGCVKCRSEEEISGDGNMMNPGIKRVDKDNNKIG
jgi:hypothetical protein